jgi:charged multivesicular body protein 3
MKSLAETDKQSGIMEEMMEDTLDSVNEDDELEAEADEEVDKVLYELTDGKLGQAGRVGGELPVRGYLPTGLFMLCVIVADQQAQKVDEEEDEAETERMRKQMEELLSS